VPHPPQPDYTSRPLYWLVILDRAVERGDFKAAAEAQRELEKLGVQVRYGRLGRAPAPGKLEGSPCA
jgi:hypothetical protein